MKYSKIEEYWRVRAKLAEKFIKEHPADPDITKDQYAAYVKWLNHKEKEPEDWNGLFEKIEDVYIDGVALESNDGLGERFEYILIPKIFIKN